MPMRPVFPSAQWPLLFQRLLQRRKSSRPYFTKSRLQPCLRPALEVEDESRRECEMPLQVHNAVVTTVGACAMGFARVDGFKG